MKFTTKKSDLLKAVSVVGRLATTRASLPILQNIYLETDGNLLKLRSTDLEQTLEMDIEGRVEENGAITIPARLLNDYLQNNTDEQVTLATDDLTTHITSTNHQARIKGMDAGEYPTLPKTKTETAITLDPIVLTNAITKTLFAAASDDTRPILTGLLFQFEEKNLTIVGTDGYRLATTQIELPTPFSGSFILPKRSLQEVIRLIEEDEVELVLTPAQARFTSGPVRLITRVLDGTFPAYEAIIPKTKKLEIRLRSESLLQSLKLASLFSRDSAYSTKLELDGTKLRLSAISATIGENTNEITLEKAVSENLTISANAQYLIDVLAVLTGDIILSFVDDKSPIVLTVPGEANYLYLVMPLRNS
ncbi:MAG TPA: DNA polymerase III subunit beta [Candidatus Saccharimonadales bacterium]|nr:DNA polymerase III subunit beta [Candidatus Saccharimonadales bacterium]